MELIAGARQTPRRGGPFLASGSGRFSKAARCGNQRSIPGHRPAVDGARIDSAWHDEAAQPGGRRGHAGEDAVSLTPVVKPTRAGSGKRVSNRKALAQIDLHWHDLRHEALSRLADDGVPVHELQLLAGHASITTTQRYMNARASSLAESMRQARERRVKRVEHGDEATAQIG